MTKISKNVVAALLVSMLVAGASGCNKKVEGPMERTGREIDKAAEKTGQQINKAVEKTGDKIEKTGEKIKNSVR